MADSLEERVFGSSPSGLVRAHETRENTKDDFVPDAVDRSYGLCEFKADTAASGKRTVSLPGQPASPEKKPLSPEEVAEMEQMKEIFHKYDANGDGHIDQAELANLMAALSADLTEEDVGTLLGHADVNDDGKIDYGEFLEWLMQPASENVAKALVIYKGAFEVLFKVYDRGDTGQISRQEFEDCHCVLQAALRMNLVESDQSIRADPLSLQEDHAEAFKMSDTDGSGYISFLQFCDWMNDHIPDGMDKKEMEELAKCLANQLEDTFEHMTMAEEGYIKEQDSHILENVVKQLAESTIALQKGMTEKKDDDVKPYWTCPPAGLSVERLKASHMKLLPLNARRIEKVTWEILCVPMQGDYDCIEERIWLAEVVRRVIWKTGKSTVEQPEYYAYDRKTFSWTAICDKSTQVFQDTFANLSPGLGTFCLLKTAANFGTQIRWNETVNALQGAIDMGFLSLAQKGEFEGYMRNVTLRSLLSEGIVEEGMPDASKSRSVDEWLKGKFVARPREVMATFSMLKIVDIEHAWADFEALCEMSIAGA